MKLHWTRSEILGRETYFLVDVTYAGRTLRMSTRDLIVPSDDGDLVYVGSCEPITFAEEVSLFAIAASPLSVPIVAGWPINVPAMVARGHTLGSARVVLSQWVEGSTYEDRKHVLRGRVIEPDVGRYQEGRTFVSASAEANLFAETAEVPPASMTIAAGRFNEIAGAGLLSDADRLPMPFVFGFPGRDPQAVSGWSTGSAPIWISKATAHHFLLLSYGHVGAANIPDEDRDGAPVWLNQDEWTTGTKFVVRAGWSDAGEPVSYVDDSSGGSYAAGYEGLEDLGVTPTNYFRPTVATELEIFAGWPEGGGIMEGGRVVRKAGDVIEYLLRFCNLPIDQSRFVTARPALAAFNLDCAFDACTPIWSLLVDRILPLLPVSIVAGPNGYYPIVWKHDASAADAVAHIDADLRPIIRVAETMETDDSQVANRLQISYGYSRRTETYLYEARLDAEYVPATNYARTTFTAGAGTAGPATITVKSTLAGLTGHGTLVTLTPGATVGLIVNSLATRTVELEFDDGVSEAADIATGLQASGVVTAPDEAAGGLAFSAANIEDASRTLVLADDATLPHPLCAASQAMLRDDEARDTGVRPWSFSTPLVWDKATAYAVLTWRAAAFAMPRRRLTILVPFQEWGWLELGQVVTFTYEAYALDAAVALIEAVEHGSDGMLGLRLVFIENPARDSFAAA